MKKYLVSYERIKQNIIDGNYKYGDKLPSKRDAALAAQVSLITIQHAYELLCDEGYIEATERSGYYVIYREKDFIDKGAHIEPLMIDARSSTTEKGEFSYSVLAKTMRKVITDYGDKILEKVPSKGCVELRQAIRNYLAITRNMHVKVEQIIIGSGAEYLYGLIAQLFDEEKSIAVENPCYSKIEKVYVAFGHHIERLTIGRDGVLTDELTRAKSNVLHVTPFHSFPSKITASISKKKEYLNWASDGKYIVEDNYDSELTVSRKLEDALFSISATDNVIYMNTFTKTIAPSVRIGYMILPEKLLDKFEEKLGFYSCSVPAFEQIVLSELIESGEYQKQINRMRRRLRVK